MRDKLMTAINSLEIKYRPYVLYNVIKYGINIPAEEGERLCVINACALGQIPGNRDGEKIAPYAADAMERFQAYRNDFINDAVGDFLSGRTNSLDEEYTGDIGSKPRPVGLRGHIPYVLLPYTAPDVMLPPEAGCVSTDAPVDDAGNMPLQYCLPMHSHDDNALYKIPKGSPHSDMKGEMLLRTRLRLKLENNGAHSESALKLDDDEDECAVR
ncbi:hypothetical protein V5799_027800 [Amblyomma americanum]|uniref:Uncharacterized protein n=1 Tax=Amblyomma americanum TaxID=6943 RepID=A0AAQ4DEP3_AMBAM